MSKLLKNKIPNKGKKSCRINVSAAIVGSFFMVVFTCATLPVSASVMSVTKNIGITASDICAILWEYSITYENWAGIGPMLEASDRFRRSSDIYKRFFFKKFVNVCCDYSLSFTPLCLMELGHWLTSLLAINQLMTWRQPFPDNLIGWGLHFSWSLSGLLNWSFLKWALLRVAWDCPGKHTITLWLWPRLSGNQSSDGSMGMVQTQYWPISGMLCFMISTITMKQLEHSAQCFRKSKIIYGSNLAKGWPIFKSA